MTDVPLPRQIADELKSLGQEGNVWAARGYWAKAQSVTDAADEFERLREMEEWANDHPTLRRGGDA